MIKRLSTLLIVAFVVAVLPLAVSADGPVDLTLTVPPAQGGQAVGGAVPFGGTQAVLDDFSRADGPIGDAWTVHDGYCNVVSNAATCGDWGRATFNSAPGDGNIAEMDVAVFSSSLDFQALLLNYGAGNTNLFLKVQNQSGGMQFGHAACYTGNNGSAFGLGFFALSSPFGSAHMKATRVGNDVTIEFTNIDGGAQPPQTYVCSGAPAAEGTGIGIAGYSGLDRVDNFGGPGAQNTLTCGSITGSAGLDPYGRVVVRWWVGAVDDAGAPVSDVVVTADMTWPAGGPVTRTRITHPNGMARFYWGYRSSGNWSIDVTGMVLAGYAFSDGPQCSAAGWY